MLYLKQFDNTFRQQLYKTIAEIEQKADIETVVIIKNESCKYKDIPLKAASLTTFAIVSILVFVPWPVNPYVIYFTTVAAFILTYLAVDVLDFIKRRLIKPERMQRMAEIYARALFQKSNMHLTQRHTGLLIFVSLFEHKVMLIGDKAIYNKVPEHVLEIIRNDLQQIFTEEETALSLLEKLKEVSGILGKYLPAVQNKENEIPDNLDVNL